MQIVAENAFEVAVLLLAFFLAVFVVLIFGVRALMILRRLPVPLDPLDMAKPRAFRTLMLGAAVFLTPLIARSFLPMEGLDPNSALAVTYGVVVALGTILWLALEGFYRARS